jgi:hypothetical protein
MAKTGGNFLPEQTVTQTQQSVVTHVTVGLNNVKEQGLCLL